MKWRTKNLETDLVIPEGYVVDIWMDGPSRQNSFIQGDGCPYIAGRGGFHIGRTPTCTPRPVKRFFLGAATLTIEPDVRGVQSYFHNYMSMSDQTGGKMKSLTHRRGTLTPETSTGAMTVVKEEGRSSRWRWSSLSKEGVIRSPYQKYMIVTVRRRHKTTSGHNLRA